MCFVTHKSTAPECMYPEAGPATPEFWLPLPLWLWASHSPSQYLSCPVKWREQQHLQHAAGRPNWMKVCKQSRECFVTFILTLRFEWPCWLCPSQFFLWKPLQNRWENAAFFWRLNTTKDWANSWTVTWFSTELHNHQSEKRFWVAGRGYMEPKLSSIR